MSNYDIRDRSQLLDLLMKCQAGEMTCLRAMEYIEPQIEATDDELDSKKGVLDAIDRALKAYDEAQRSKISGPSLVKPDGMARESQGEVDQLRTELSRLQTRLDACDKERVADKDQHAAIFEAYDVERGQLQRALEKAENERDIARAHQCAAELESTALASDIEPLRALVVKKDEALKWIAERGWNPMGTTIENAALAYDDHCEAAQALALTPADLKGMVLVPSYTKDWCVVDPKELAELRRKADLCDQKAGVFRCDSKNSPHGLTEAGIPARQRGEGGVG